MCILEKNGSLANKHSLRRTGRKPRRAMGSYWQDTTSSKTERGTRKEKVGGLNADRISRFMSELCSTCPLPVCSCGGVALGSAVAWVWRLERVCVRAMGAAAHSKGPAESFLAKSAPLPDES